MYLSNHDALNQDFSLKMASKSAVVKLGTDLIKRLFGHETDNGDEEAESLQTNLSLQERLKLAVGSVKPLKTSSKQSNASIDLKKEFQFYDRNQKRTPLLDKLYEALSTVQPTSTQSERNFSLAGGFVTKLRTRLKDEHVNALCFLKSFFLKYPDV